MNENSERREKNATSRINRRKYIFECNLLAAQNYSITTQFIHSDIKLNECSKSNDGCVKEYCPSAYDKIVHLRDERTSVSN